MTIPKGNIDFGQVKVELSEPQAKALELLKKGQRVLFLAGRRAGKTFLADLVRDNMPNLHVVDDSDRAGTPLDVGGKLPDLICATPTPGLLKFYETNKDALVLVRAPTYTAPWVDAEAHIDLMRSLSPTVARTEVFAEWPETVKEDTFVPKPVTKHPTMKPTTARGRLMGTYRFVGVTQTSAGQVVELKLDPTYSPSTVFLPVDMVPEDWLVQNPSQFSGELNIYQLNRLRPDHVCYLSRTYNGDTYFYAVES